jgi:hypothetical protein
MRVQAPFSLGPIKTGHIVCDFCLGAGYHRQGALCNRKAVINLVQVGYGSTMCGKNFAPRARHAILSSRKSLARIHLPEFIRQSFDMLWPEDDDAQKTGS